MRVIKPVLILFFAVLISACTSDDGTPTPTVNVEAQMLVGSWKATESSQEGSASTPGIPIEGTITSFGKDFTAEISFTESPNSFSSSGGYTDVISVSIVGQSYTEEVPIVIGDVLSLGTWAVDNGELTLSQGGQSQLVRVTELTATTLKIEVDIQENVTIESLPITINSTVKMTLTKQ